MSTNEREHRNGAHRARALVASAIVLVLAAVSACGGAEEAAPPSTASTRPANLGPVLAVRGDTVEVRMDDHRFDFAALTVPAGRIVFQAQNFGFEHHNMEIRLDTALLVHMERDVAPGGISFLEAALEPGEYQIVCSISGHDDKGMRVTLTVFDGGADPSFGGAGTAEGSAGS